MSELPRAELADQPASPPVRQALRLVLGPATQVTAALLAIVIGVSIYIVHRDHTFTGHATGRALDHRTVGTAAPAYHVDVAYRDADGRDHTGTIFVNQVPIAATYPVDYDPAHPDRVVWHQPWYTNTVLVIVLLVFGSAAVFAVFVAMMAGAQRFRAVQRGEMVDRGFGRRTLPLLVIPVICIVLAVVLTRLLVE